MVTLSSYASYENVVPKASRWACVRPTYQRAVFQHTFHFSQNLSLIDASLTRHVCFKVYFFNALFNTTLGLHFRGFCTALLGPLICSARCFVPCFVPCFARFGASFFSSGYDQYRDSIF
jgi:hypothetical protein